MIVFFVILLSVVTILFLPLNVCVTYLKYRDINRCKVNAGILKEVFCLYDSEKKKNKKENVSEKNIPDKEKNKIDIKYIEEIISETGKLFSYFSKKLCVVFMKLHFHIGLDDAAHTGIATGAMWGTAYNCVSVIENTFLLKKHSVHIAPDFTQSVFETDIEVKLKIKIVYVIIFAYKTYKSIKKLNLI